MRTGWRYRVASAAGAVGLTAVAVIVANLAATQELFTTYVPLFNRLEVTVLDRESLRWAVPLSAATVALALLPLYKPRPRRILDTIFLAQKRVVTAGLALATLGYFQWSHRLPRATLVMSIGLLTIAIPLWFVWIRTRPIDDDGRTILVGDDPEQLRVVASAVDAPIVGYLCPDAVSFEPSADAAADGGVTAMEESAGGDRIVDGPSSLPRLGGLARIEDVLVEQDVDTVVLAFDDADRAEFFGALDACYEHGVDAKVHRDYADSVLVADDAVGEIVDVDIRPWDPQDHLFKRAFDLCFAGIGLLVATPLMVLIAIAITLDSDGPVLYEQERTAVFGEPFSVYKFRSMITDAEDGTGAKLSEEDVGGRDPRVTRVGQVLRTTHLDEIPQLWSILRGDMSVVGPRPERPELDSEIQRDGIEWEKRWFVKPGLTGLAQINDVTGHDPREKLRMDLEYVRRQSLRFDVKIVIRQIWKVGIDVIATLR